MSKIINPQQVAVKQNALHDLQSCDEFVLITQTNGGVQVLTAATMSNGLGLVESAKVHLVTQLQLALMPSRKQI